ncbi:interferon-inducible GTPase-domain-containing protein [Sphaerosporella brunnea]|uniref:Interferon-inducible GTPase-domain-containing protein n=1 Tax=Sphaerosporella brunnea TaxID=1250544 RepID=A0A5J5ESJ9_9PEZI|nr:interferon-inducible GTPase-domain-containing protein [Sphaerosporella brunnea]
MGAAGSTVIPLALTVLIRLLEALRETPQAVNNTVSEIEGRAEEALKQAAKAAIEAKKAEEEANRKEQEAYRLERDSRQREEQTKREMALLEQEVKEARHNLARGIQPVIWPTADELAAAKLKAQYRDDLLHFAVCGPSGSGKSSLINAFRGLRNNQSGASRTGVVECTEEMHRYPDHRKEMPYPRFVWYDVPGAGTSTIPGWQYFIQQGLFIFDFIIVVYDTRFTQIDADILDNCRRFNIPAFIVRSKANQHIRNLQDDEDLDYTTARDKFVAETHRDLKSNLRKFGLWSDGDPLPLHIVSNAALYDFIKDSECTIRQHETGEVLSEVPRTGGKKRAEYIDEPQLVYNLLQTAYKRRYPPLSGLAGAATTAITVGISMLGGERCF